MATSTAKMALVTGANRGLGLEWVRQLLNDGFDVIATCRNPASASDLQAVGDASENNLEVVQLDMLDEAAIKTVGSELASRTIDFVVLNAGIMGQLPCGMGDAQFENMDNYNRCFKVNAIAPLLFVNAIQNAIIQSELKTILATSTGLSSISGNESGGNIAYRMSKAALNMGMKEVASKLNQPHGVSVITMLPGWVKTDMGGSGASLTTESSVAQMFGVVKQKWEDGTVENAKLYSYNGSVWDF